MTSKENSSRNHLRITHEKKNLVIQELEGQGLLLHALEEEVGKDFDPFDLICHVVYDKPPLSRKERAEAVRKKNYFTKYGEKTRAVLNALLGLETQIYMAEA